MRGQDLSSTVVSDLNFLVDYDSWGKTMTIIHDTANSPPPNSQFSMVVHPDSVLSSPFSIVVHPD